MSNTTRIKVQCTVYNYSLKTNALMYIYYTYSRRQADRKKRTHSHACMHVHTHTHAHTQTHTHTTFPAFSIIESYLDVISGTKRVEKQLYNVVKINSLLINGQKLS